MSGGLELSHVGGAAWQVNKNVVEIGGDSKGKASNGLGNSMSSTETTQELWVCWGHQKLSPSLRRGVIWTCFGSCGQLGLKETQRWVWYVRWAGLYPKAQRSKKRSLPSRRASNNQQIQFSRHCICITLKAHFKIHAHNVISF